MKKVAIYGTGGHGREIANIFQHKDYKNQYEICAFIDDFHRADLNPNAVANRIKILNINELKPSNQNCLVTIAVGSPDARRKLVKKAQDFGFTTIGIVHPSVEISEFISIGDGTVIFPGCVLSVNIEIGEHVNINSMCSISHDVKIANFVTLSPGVVICGNVHIKENVFMGAGSTVINGTSSSPITIAANCIIGAGACVTESIETPGTYVGVPARLLKS